MKLKKEINKWQDIWLSLTTCLRHASFVKKWKDFKYRLSYCSWIVFDYAVQSHSPCIYSRTIYQQAVWSRNNIVIATTYKYNYKQMEIVKWSANSNCHKARGSLLSLYWTDCCAPAKCICGAFVIHCAVCAAKQCFSMSNTHGEVYICVCWMFFLISTTLNTNLTWLSDCKWSIHSCTAQIFHHAVLSTCILNEMVSMTIS